MNCIHSRVRDQWCQFRGPLLVGSKCVCPPCPGSSVITWGNAILSAMNFPVHLSRVTRNSSVKWTFATHFIQCHLCAAKCVMMRLPRYTNTSFGGRRQTSIRSGFDRRDVDMNANKLCEIHVFAWELFISLTCSLPSLITSIGPPGEQVTTCRLHAPVLVRSIGIYGNTEQCHQIEQYRLSAYGRCLRVAHAQVSSGHYGTTLMTALSDYLKRMIHVLQKFLHANNVHNPSVFSRSDQWAHCQ